MFRKPFRFIFNVLITSLLNPVVLVGVFGPLIQYVNTVLLSYRLNFERVGDLLELSDALENEWVLALVSFNTQVFVLLLAWVFIFVEFIRVILPLAQDHNLKELRKIANGSHVSYIVFISVVVFFFGGIASFLMGIFASPDLIPLYRPPGGIITGIPAVPPIESSITIARVLIIAQGILFSYWERRVLPDQIEKSKTDESINQGHEGA